MIKDPIGTKGARLTTFVALPSRYLVYMPRGEGVGVSTRIEDEAERQRLKTADQRATCADAEQRRLHRAHRCAGRVRRQPVRGHGVPRQAVGARARERAEGASRPDRARRSAAHAAHAARRAGARREPRAGGFAARACAHDRVRRRVHSRARPRASSCTAGRARSSICTASRRRSRARWSARCR